MWLRDFRQDLQYASRSFARQRSFTAVAIVTIALGVGANTAIFSVVNAVLLRPLPYRNADRLVRIFDISAPAAAPAPSGVRRRGITVAELAALREQSKTLTHLGMSLGSGGMLTVRKPSRRLGGARVTVGMFDALGATPLIGRGFDTRDEVEGADAIILSHTT